MSIPLQPLTKPHADKTLGLPELSSGGPEEEIERAVQEILLEWLTVYFSGVPFDTAGGGDPKTFPLCEIKFGETTPEKPGTRPIIHTWISERRAEDPVRVPPQQWRFKGDWKFSVMIKTNNQLPVSGAGEGLGDSAEKASQRLCRRVADQLVWLLKSAHTQSLTLKGVSRIKVLTDPVLTSSGSFHSRVLTFSSEIIQHIPRNDP